MKRKWKIRFFVTFSLACLIVVFSGCGGAGTAQTHSYESVVTEPTCTEGGYTTYTCSDCGDSYTDDYTEALGHSYESVKTESTCTEGGYTTYTCSRCGDSYVADKTAAAGHSYGDDNVCTVCGDIYVEGSEGLAYTLNSSEDSYSVSGIGTATDTEIVVASDYDGLPVTAVASNAFDSCGDITAVILHDGITGIGSYAFNKCTSLESVTIGSGLTEVGEDAFYGCSALAAVYIEDLAAWCEISFADKHANPVYNAGILYLNGESVTGLEIPDSITGIGSYAFAGCTSLESVTIGSNVTEVGGSAFLDCENLTAVYTEDLAAWCGISFADALANPLFEAGSLYLNGESVTELEVPDGVTEIESYAFSGWLLSSVTIGSGVTKIGEGAFFFCTSLESITIPDSVTDMGGGIRSCTAPTLRVSQSGAA